MAVHKKSSGYLSDHPQMASFGRRRSRFVDRHYLIFFMAGVAKIFCGIHSSKMFSIPAMHFMARNTGDNPAFQCRQIIRHICSPFLGYSNRMRYTQNFGRMTSVTAFDCKLLLCDHISMLTIYRFLSIRACVRRNQKLSLSGCRLYFNNIQQSFLRALWFQHICRALNQAKRRVDLQSPILQSYFPLL